MKSILLKLSGEFIGSLVTEQDAVLAAERMSNFACQLKTILADHQVSIVVGGGNYFRGSIQGRFMAMNRIVSDQVGMMATVMNGLILTHFLQEAGIVAVLFGASAITGVVAPFSVSEGRQALAQGSVPLFVAGTGLPFFSTDTCAVIRAAQVGAQEVWKATKVKGIYDQDPVHHPDALFIKQLTHAQALEKKIAVVDQMAFSMAQDAGLCLRVFSMHGQNWLTAAAYDDIGSRVVPNKK